MKPLGEIFGKRRVYWIIAILLLIYGGVSLVIFLNFFHIEHFVVVARGGERLLNYSNATPDFGNFSARAMRGRPEDSLTLPLIMNLIGSFISIVGGIGLINLLRKREKKEAKREVIDTMVMPDEKLVIRELEGHHGEMTQTEIVRLTKLSKVKVHRVVKRLESLGIVKKYPFGMTNKIKLEKSLYKDSDE